LFELRKTLCERNTLQALPYLKPPPAKGGGTAKAPLSFSLPCAKGGGLPKASRRDC